MPTDFVEMVDDLLDDENMAVDIILTPDGGSPVALKALVGFSDQSASFGAMLVEQDVLPLEIRRVDYPAQPLRGDLVSCAGIDRFVGESGTADPISGTWAFRAARL